jgi:hypothetical protein
VDELSLDVMSSLLELPPQASVSVGFVEVLLESTLDSVDRLSVWNQGCQSFWEVVCGFVVVSSTTFLILTQLKQMLNDFIMENHFKALNEVGLLTLILRCGLYFNSTLQN